MKQATLRVRGNGHERLVVAPLPAVIGRDAACELALDDDLVSRRHAQLTWNAESCRLHLQDLGSVNGTLVNDRPTREAWLAAADRIGIGQSELIIEAFDRLPAEPSTAPLDQAPAALDSVAAVVQTVRSNIRERAESLQEGGERLLLEWLDAAIVAERPSASLAAINDLRQRAWAELLGYGPLQPLLADESIDEIMVNGPQQVFVERAGRLQLTEVRFADDAALRTLIERIVTPLGRRIDTASPLCDARLPDGSRVHAALPPVSLNGPLLTIRKFRRQKLDLQALLQGGALSPEMAAFLRRAVVARCNLVVSGGTGSGKTTMLNALSGFIDAGERIISIEDAAELQLQQAHVLRLEARPANADGAGAITIRELLRNALRMRPDRIIVGECRGAEALDMLQALNTGHDGGLTTVHANAPRDAVARLETMCLLANVGLPHRAIREQIVRAVDIIIQVARFADGRRRIAEIAELQRLEGDVPVLQTLYRFEASASRFVASGFAARCLERESHTC